MRFGVVFYCVVLCEDVSERISAKPQDLLEFDLLPTRGLRQKVIYGIVYLSALLAGDVCLQFFQLLTNAQIQL
ncbi:hypothetical protein AC628_18155 [Bradyrhizobium sp. NAS96.2]|nr:hypothetical protein AC628_18155 [Bradyrhizobium sp. NAS96.2]